MEDPTAVQAQDTEVQIPQEELNEVAIEKEVDRRMNIERTRLIGEVRRAYQTQLEKEVLEIRASFEKQNQEQMQKVIEEFKKKQEPPTHQEIQQLLDAEFLTFQFKVTWPSKNGKQAKSETITIGEMSAANEKKILRLLKDKAKPLLEQLGPGLVSVLQGTTEDKISAVIDLLDPASEIVTEVVAMILGVASGRDITPKMINETLSTSRQMSIISAQMECNRLRDFFSHAVRIAGS